MATYGCRLWLWLCDVRQQFKWSLPSNWVLSGFVAIKLKFRVNGKIRISSCTMGHIATCKCEVLNWISQSAARCIVRQQLFYFSVDNSNGSENFHSFAAVRHAHRENWKCRIHGFLDDCIRSNERIKQCAYNVCFPFRQLTYPRETCTRIHFVSFSSLFFRFEPKKKRPKKKKKLTKKTGFYGVVRNTCTTQNNIVENGSTTHGSRHRVWSMNEVDWKEASSMKCTKEI